MKSRIFVIWLFIFAACNSAADEQIDVSKRMDVEVEKRISLYTQTLNENCQERVMTEAVRRADSVITLEARLLSDTSFKPIRPEKPPIQILQDTTPVKPFIKPKRDSIRSRQ